MQNSPAEVLDAWTALLVAHRRLTNLLDDQLRRRCAISLDEYDVLYQVRLAGAPLRMTQLAQRLVISRPTASRVVDRLVGRGWIERWHDSGDRRLVLLQLSAPGRRAQARAGRVHVEGINQYFGRPLAAYDLRAVASALRAVAYDAHPAQEAHEVHRAQEAHEANPAQEAHEAHPEGLSGAGE